MTPQRRAIGMLILALVLIAVGIIAVVDGFLGKGMKKPRGTVLLFLYLFGLAKVM
jgi:hypothetical protein